MTSAGTQVAAVIGSPIRHSLSPVLHNAAFAAAGLDWVFVAFDVPAGRGEAAVTAMADLGLAGLSVTMPHKGAAAVAVDRLSPDAAALAAVNCVVREDGRLVGHSTDGAGFLDSLRYEADIVPAGRRVVVLGAGGAARAVVRAVAGAGAAEVVVVNRTASRGEAAAALAGTVGRAGTLADVAIADLVVNATPVGMGEPGGDDLPVPAASLGAHQVVVDLVYQPLVTPLLNAAAERGATTVGGLGMLVHQAAHAFRLWTGEEPPLAAMRGAVGLDQPPPPGRG